MTMTDPIADMLTRVRNAQSAGKDTVSMPTSKKLVEICPACSAASARQLSRPVAAS